MRLNVVAIVLHAIFLPEVALVNYCSSGFSYSQLNNDANVSFVAITGHSHG